MLRVQTAALALLTVPAAVAWAESGHYLNSGHFNCGLSTDAEAAATTVNVFLAINGGDDALVASNLTEDFRALRDVQLVYTEREADLVVTLLPMNIKDDHGTTLGYVATIVVAYPCVRTDDQTPFKMYEDSVILLSNTAEGLARRAVAQVNTDWLEDVRKEHATFRNIQRTLRALPKP